jgi:hypothetical protein
MIRVEATDPREIRAHKEGVVNYWRSWSEHNRGNMLALLSPNFVCRSVFAETVAGITEWTRVFEMFDTSRPDLGQEVVSIIAEGGSVVCEVRETATFTGPMELPMGVMKPTNLAYELTFASFFGFDPLGLIVEQRVYWDAAGWAQKIGIDPKLFAPGYAPRTPKENPFEEEGLGSSVAASLQDDRAYQRLQFRAF